MTPVKKKSKPVPVKKMSAEKLHEIAQAAMADFTAEAQKRYDHAHALYAKQDDETQDALDRMTTLLCRIARRHMWVAAGSRHDRLVMSIPEETIYHNMFYMANEILKDLAIFDIRVAGYTFPPDVCVECGKPVEVVKKKKVKS